VALLARLLLAAAGPVAAEPSTAAAISRRADPEWPVRRLAEQQVPHWVQAACQTQAVFRVQAVSPCRVRAS
jgi:hypothetical protein